MTPLPDETQMRAYVAAWRSRLQAEEARRRRRVERAWSEARRLARILIAEFGATEVWVFGSLALERPEAGATRRFRADSDIDLAARGVPPGLFFRAYGRIMMASSFDVDLVDVDAVPPTLRESILREGVLLGKGSRAGNPSPLGR
ncbi:MAG: hypothetical protein AB1609_11690 [Bacillota bacterium]